MPRRSALLPFSMPSKNDGPGRGLAPVPSMLDLIRLSPKLLFPPGGVDLYRQIALLTGMSEDAEVLDVACGKGVPLSYFVREYGVHGSGVEEDGRLVTQAEARSREDGMADRLQFQTGHSDALPYRDAIFDVVVGELGLAARCDPAAAVAELVRVTKPGGFVVLVQLVWKAPVDEERQQVLSSHLGARPLMLVEWRRILKEAGIVELHSEDWSDEETAFRPSAAKPFPDFAEIFSLPEKIGILRRAGTRWGWRGVATVMEREREVHRLLTRERVLGLDLLRGRKPPAETVEVDAGAADEAQAVEAAAEEPSPDGVETEEPSSDGVETEASEPGTETSGLPLFDGGEDETTEHHERRDEST